MLEVVDRREALGAALERLHARGGRIGLVPTMGALHEGHEALVAESARRCATTVLSVFVNPLQFDDAGDLARYPRALGEDLARAEAAGATVCFAPSTGEMYPAGQPQVVVDPGPLGAVLEGASRPGHFLGVATIVAKLFALVRPDTAFFGEKDYQQLVLVRRLVVDLSFPVEVVGVETVRDRDGLALSSRNRLLDGPAREAAGALHGALVAGREALRCGARPSAAAAEMEARLAETPGVEADYVVVRDAADLSEVEDATPPDLLRLLVAARVGGVRLIDNLGAP